MCTWAGQLGAYKNRQFCAWYHLCIVLVEVQTDYSVAVVVLIKTGGVSENIPSSYTCFRSDVKIFFAFHLTQLQQTGWRRHSATDPRLRIF